MGRGLVRRVSRRRVSCTRECGLEACALRPSATLQVPDGLLPEVQEQNLIRFIGQVHLTCLGQDSGTLRRVKGTLAQHGGSLPHSHSMLP